MNLVTRSGMESITLSHAICNRFPRQPICGETRLQQDYVILWVFCVIADTSGDTCVSHAWYVIIKTVLQYSSFVISLLSCWSQFQGIWECPKYSWQSFVQESHVSRFVRSELRSGWMNGIQFQWDISKQLIMDGVSSGLEPCGSNALSWIFQI